MSFKLHTPTSAVGSRAGGAGIFAVVCCSLLFLYTVCGAASILVLCYREASLEWVARAKRISGVGRLNVRGGMGKGMGMVMRGLLTTNPGRGDQGYRLLYLLAAAL